MKILVATDGSETAKKAVEYAADIAGPLKADVTVLAVAQEVAQIHAAEAYAEMPNFEVNINEALRKTAQESLNAAEKVFKEKGLDVTTKLEIGDASGLICDIAEEGNFDQVVIGSRGLGGFKGMFLGSVSNKVVNCTAKNVTVIK